MTILKCKMCGGNIQATGESHGICDSCGCEVTLPKIDDDKRILFYDRGNYYRQRGEFDRAYSEFEHIIADNLNDAEIYWCLVLCRYGVTYEQDARTGDYKPTISRMSFSSVLEDSDYLKAIENADEYTKSIYRSEAEKIAKIQDKYLEISRKEEPYDVFICFKAEEDNGQRTKGSVIAQDIYEHLTDKGLKVFFSRVTLLDKLAEEFEPYIFAALNSAKIMLVVANNPAHLQSVWVKNEWTRFLSLKQKHRDKALVPVYIDMSPYELPLEFSTNSHQAIDASRLGYHQDLIRGVLKLLGKQEPVQRVDSQKYVQQFLDEAASALADRNFSMAATMADQALTYDPENGYAHLYELLAKNMVSEINSLLNRPDNWLENATLKRVIQYGDSNLKEQVEQFLNEYRNRTDYNTAQKLMTEEKYKEALVYLERLGNYSDAPAIKARCEKLEYHQKMLNTYRAETENDVSGFLSRKMQKEHPKEYQKFVDMLQKIPKMPRAEVSVRACLACGIGLIALGIIGLVSNTIGGGRNGIYFLFAILTFGCYVGQFALGVYYGMILHHSKKLTLLISGLPLLVWWLCLGPNEDYSIYVRLFIGIIPLLKYRKLAKKEKNYYAAVREMETYEQQMINPMEQSIIHDIQEYYGKELSSEEIGRFVSVREKLNVKLEK